VRVGGKDELAFSANGSAMESFGTLLTVHNLFASKEALDEDFASGGTAALPETLDQLEGDYRRPGGAAEERAGAPASASAR
jgi:hypothetical protein